MIIYATGFVAYNFYGGNMKYKEWLSEWLYTCVKPFVKVRTYEKYERIVRRNLSPVLGEYELEALSGIVLQKYVGRLVEEYSANTVGGIISVLKCSLKQAVKMGLVKLQHADCIMRPKIQEKKIESFTVDEQKKIEQYIVNNEKIKLIGILICLYTGLRIGELMALEWDDIDFIGGFIQVNKSCHDGWGKSGYQKIIERPKTSNSQRIIPIPKTLMPYIRKLKKHNIGNFILEINGKLLSIRAYQRTFELLLKKLNIPHRGFHSLRHTFATRALECGMDVKTLSEILGHRNPSITLSRYAHSLMEHKCAMMNKLGKNLQ